MKEQVSRLAKSAASNICSYFVSFGYTGERLIPGLRRKDWISRALLLAVKSVWPHKVGSSWFTSGILNTSTVWVFHATLWRRREFFGVVWGCLARVKCGNIMSGLRKCCDCRKSHLLCDLPKALTDKTQVYGWARVSRILCAKHKNASWVFNFRWFCLRKPILLSKIVDLNLFLADT